MSDRKLMYLNGLRGLAALMVVFSHYTLSFFPALHTGIKNDSHNSFEVLASASPINVIYNGSFAVFIFFILSGFVLSYKYWSQDKFGFSDLLSNIVKRYFRLNIPIAVSIMLAFLLLSLGLFYNKDFIGLNDSLKWLPGIYGFSSDFIEALKEAVYGVIIYGKQNYNLILWTLKYEFYGSIMIYIFMFLFRKTKIRFILYPLLLILFWNSYYLAFFLGLLLSDLYASDRLIIKNRLIISLMFLIAIFFGSYPWREQFGEPTHLYGFLKFNFLMVDSYYNFYHTAGAFLLLICVLNTNLIKKILASRVCVFLGEISFSLYLLHLLILCSFSSYVMNHLTAHLSYNLSFSIMFILSLAVLFTVSYLYYKYVDLFGIKSAVTAVRTIKLLNTKEDVATFLPFKSKPWDNYISKDN
ncbi:hypothetical protein A8L34_24715 [Bacillus sp. FJAT-27264]|uniref:acyltransferase family protein n=1 Tax=Paenibacillus sp. (strain DSM 101736 / FJAT-27264) TaxID=1850362 RepID=UPI000807DB6F|nr:acyltransferase [Bacillus sp. FJAT-27264]OBZ07838.1 hypothetical protein A8L34_24715 [Bacillus sp. FJAT-27264]